MKNILCLLRVISFSCIGATFTILPLQRANAFTIDGGSNYAVLYEGAGNNTLHITNVTINGNVGVGGTTSKVSDSGPSTITGTVQFSGSDTTPSRFSSSNSSNTFNGGMTSPPYMPSFNVAAVANALSNLNILNTTLGGESGTDVSIGTGTGKTLTINASAGTFHGNDSVFNVTGFNTTNGETLTINGDGVHDVVLNFIGLSANFNNQVVLTGGLNSDDVLFNFVGGSNLTGGPTLQINDNASASSMNQVQGDFLNPNGPISVVNANLLGRVFGGDTHDMQIVSGSTITSPAGVPDSGSTFMLLGFSLTLLIGAMRVSKVQSRS